MSAVLKELRRELDERIVVNKARLKYLEDCDRMFSGGRSKKRRRSGTTVININVYNNIWR